MTAANEVTAIHAWAGHRCLMLMPVAWLTFKPLGSGETMSPHLARFILIPLGLTFAFCRQPGPPSNDVSSEASAGAAGQPGVTAGATTEPVAAAPWPATCDDAAARAIEKMGPNGVSGLAMFDILPALATLDHFSRDRVLGRARSALSPGAAERVRFAAAFVTTLRMPRSPAALPNDQVEDARRFLVSRLKPANKWAGQTGHRPRLRFHAARSGSRSITRIRM
jgi:hypothetical protein